MSEDRKRTKKQPIDFAYGHIQPQAPEVEKAVLGALMIDKDAYVEVCEILRAESFYEPRHQKIYAAIQQLTVDEKPVDLLTVTEQLSKNGDLDEVGGSEFKSGNLCQYRVSRKHCGSEIPVKADHFLCKRHRYESLRRDL